MKSVMKHAFSMIPRTEIMRSGFNRSSCWKSTFNEGYLIPFFVDEILPGDTFKLKHSILARLTTPIVPFMDNVFLETFFFFVPYRLIWDNWQRFNGERDNPEDSTDFLIPQMTAPQNGFANQSIFDYFGLPTKVSDFKFSALPFRAYNLIYNEWFRDENLQDSVTVVKGDSDDISNYTLLKRGKRHDYFTSCLPWPQKGEPVDIPLSGGIESKTLTNDIKLAHGFKLRAGDASVLGPTVATVGPGYASSQGETPWRSTVTRLDGGSYDIQATYYPGAVVGLSNFDDNVRITQTELDAVKNNLFISGGNAISVNDLRLAFQVQRMLERDARGGTRYTEILRSHFGVISPDARLQRPEYLGGSSSKLNVDPVAQTASTDATTPQGNLAAFGYVADHKSIFNHSFVEHGIVIGLLNVRADLTYQQGLERFWSRRTRYDFYWPSLAHLGEQAVLNREIYTQPDSVVNAGGTPVNDDAFGYQERYAEYRYKNSLITGKLRSNDSNSLDVWHLSQNFENLPTLSSDFIQDNPPISRVVAVQSEPHFIVDVYFNLHCVRPMPVYSVPGLVDHY